MAFGGQRLTTSVGPGTLQAMLTATERYSVRSYEVDTSARLTAVALCNYLQESAGLHARQLGVSVDQLLREGMTWFLWRLHLRIGELPSWGETVTIETWPAELGKPFAIRDFRLLVGDREFGVATSAWLLMDIVKKRPIRHYPQRIRDLHPEEPKRALPDSFQRLPALDAPDATGDFVARQGDLDLNGHLNHVATIAAMFEPLSVNRNVERRLESLEVEFRGEGRHGDALEARCRSGESEVQHLLVRKADGKELARARSRWRLMPSLD